MYWPKFSKQSFWRKIKATKKTPSGVSCAYLQWTKYAGLKMFSDKKSMNQSFRGQKRAAKHSLAPKVGEKIVIDVITFSQDPEAASWDIVDAPIPRKIKLYCFFTESAQKIGRRVPFSKKSVLDKTLQKIGIYHDDLHRWNMGYVGKKLVCIDFDDASCSLGRNK